MNNTTLTGRLTRDPEVRHNIGANGKLSVAKYTLAVNRSRAKEGQSADFIRCTAFGPKATFAENYLAKGMKIEVSGNIRTGSYVNKEGRTINTFELIVGDQEFAESQKKNAEIYANNHQPQNGDGGDVELPFE